jgi:hypothetical protein
MQHYKAEISRDHPTSILFVIDQSGSMDEAMSTGVSKSEFLADVVNKTIYTLITNSTKAEGVRDYFHLGVIGYGGGGVGAAFGGALSNEIMHPISDVEKSPLRVEDRNKIEDDGAGGVIERKVKFPVWFLPSASGGTPMCAGLTAAAEVLVPWCDSRPDGYPPTVLHVTDGASTDGDPESVASIVRQISTNDGPCLLFNVNISTLQGQGIHFPDSASGLPDSYAKQLFEMSSGLPPDVARMATERGYTVTDGARGFMFNADPKDIANFFEIGTRPRLSVER